MTVSDLLQKLFSESVNLIFFFLGAAVGFLSIVAVYRLTGRKSKKKKRDVTPATGELAMTAAERFKSNRTGLDFKAKILSFRDCLFFAAESYVEKTDEKSTYKLFNNNISLAFTAYELLDFTEALARAWRENIEDLFDSKTFKIMFFAYGLVDGNIGKDPKEVKIAYVVKALTEKKEEKTGIVAKAAKKVKAAAFKIAVKPTVEKTVDDLFASAIRSFSDNLVVLYSGETLLPILPAEEKYEGGEAV